MGMKTIEKMLLKAGDLVALAATARKVSPGEVEASVRLLESWGLRVAVPEGLFEADNQMAGSDARRAERFQKLIDDREVRAIICARGGYGTVRMIDRVDFAPLARCPKWVVGYSDVTVLHSHIGRHCGIPTLHATMPLNVPADACRTAYPATESLRQMLFEGKAHYEFVNEGVVVNRQGCCTAPVVGGNLSVLYSLLGSASDIDTEGRILLLEDLDEYLYHIDRMMMALRRAGKLQGLRGLLVGAMSDMHDNAVPFGCTAEEIVRDAVADYGYPVAFNCLFGHIGTENRALPLGVETKVRVASDSVAIDVGI